jgi:cytidylate kinase
VLPIRVVTISASFGAGGSVVGPAVSEELGWQFLDRAIPAQVAERLAIPLGEALSRDEQDAPGALRRLLSAMVYVEPFGSPAPLVRGEPGSAKTDFVAATEHVVREACVLRGEPGVLHVRLDGPVEARIARVRESEGLDEVAAKRRQQNSDRARDAYLRRFYNVDPTDSRLYHMVLDSTRIPLNICAQLVAQTARAGVAH